MMIFSLVAMIGLEKCCITFAYLQWLCHSGERAVACGPLVIIIFVVLMKNRISSEYVPRLKVLTFADLMCCRIVVIENTQAQYFDSLISNYTRVFSTMTIRFCINFANFLLHSLSLSWFLLEQRNGKRQ